MAFMPLYTKVPSPWIADATEVKSYTLWHFTFWDVGGVLLFSSLHWR